MDDEARARQLYEAVIRTINDVGMIGLLAAAGDAKARVPFDKASPKTRTIFNTLASNLTAPAPKA
jgi:hypothetical protein